MKDHIIEILDQLIEEHHTGDERTAILQEYANETTILNKMDKAQESFIPGRLDQASGLNKLDELMSEVSSFMNRHFTHEETVLLGAIEELNDAELLKAFTTLLREHDYLKIRLSRVRELIDDLKSGTLVRQHWDASANDLKAYLKHTRKLLEMHSGTETELFINLRNHLAEKLSQGEQK